MGILDKNKNQLDLLYHSNLRNIGIFITISLAVHNFNYQTKFMKTKGKYVIPISFLLVSLLLNLELINNSIENEENSYIIDIVPFITFTLILILISKTFYNLIDSLK